MTHLQEGDALPEFEGPDQNGNLITSEEFKGKRLILFFYPKDNTPGCTAEACNLRDNYKPLLDKGFEVVGVSADTERKHRNFIGKYDLPFPLIADTERKVIDAFGVWAQKQMFGKKYFGIVRTTFVSDGKGKIDKIFTKVDTENHTAQILEALNMNE